MSDNSLLWVGGGIAAVLLLLLLLASASPDPSANAAFEEPISAESSSLLQMSGSSQASLESAAMEVPPAATAGASSACSSCTTPSPCFVRVTTSPCQAPPEPDPCAPPAWACDDPCVRHIPPQQPAPRATACTCEPACGDPEPSAWPCNPVADPCAEMPRPAVVMPQHPSGVIASNAATVLILRSYPEWVTEGQTVQLHGRITTPGTAPVCFEWTAERGSFDDPTSLDPVYTAPAAIRWGDSVCIKLEIHDAYSLRRYDQIELRLKKVLY